ncbi:MAG: [NiFe]-hydrogenase assembly chaperone HybE [Gammaproteobacteria bacterium]|nr:[NiFe]-hydrogenase assembly chaperone HybE [Gammaproteobacteria bacterium]
MSGGWQGIPETLLDDEKLLAAVIEEHEAIYRRYFLQEPGVNHQLPIRLQSFRRIDSWRLFLVLTPWMLARCFIPDSDPGIPVPDEWLPDARAGRPYQVIGPTCQLELLTGKQKAHLNYSPALGHYLLHPLVLSMSDYESPEAIFQEWNVVIETRNENLKKLRQRSRQQEEITRREFFRGFGSS